MPDKQLNSLISIMSIQQCRLLRTILKYKDDELVQVLK